MNPLTDEELEQRIEAAKQAERERIAQELRQAIVNVARRSWAVYEEKPDAIP